MNLNNRVKKLTERIQARGSELKLYFIDQEDGFYIYDNLRMTKPEFDDWQNSLTGDRIVIVDDYGDEESPADSCSS